MNYHYLILIYLDEKEFDKVNILIQKINKIKKLYNSVLSKFFMIEKK